MNNKKMNNNKNKIIIIIIIIKIIKIKGSIPDMNTSGYSHNYR